MLLKIYRGIGPGTILLIIISAVLVWLQPLADPARPLMYHDTHPAPLYSVLLKLLGEKPLPSTIFSVVLVLATGSYMVHLNTRLFFINERTFLPASLYVLLSGYISSIQVINPALPASLLLLMSVDRLTLSYRKPGIAYNLFDASMLIGIAALLYTNAIWFFLLIPIGISLFRSLNLREILISLAGLISPVLILYSVYYLTGQDILWLSEFFLKSITTVVPDYYWSAEFIIVSSVNSLIFIVSLLHMWSIFNTKKVRSRKIFSLFTWMLFLTLLVYLIIPSASAELMYIFLIPAVYILTHYLVMVRNKKIANYVFAIIFLSVIFMQLS